MKRKVLALVALAALLAAPAAFAEDETRSVLQAGAVTVWLRCDLETILDRIGEDPSRPLASDRETMRELLEQRQPAYEQAQLAFDDQGTASGLVDRILDTLQREGEP